VWTREQFTVLAPSTAVTCYVFPIIMGAGAANDAYNIDGVQLEQNSAASDWADPAQRAFYYEVRILNTITIDEQGLRRELDRITPAGITYDITYTPTP
jgi:hypothetical protein